MHKELHFPNYKNSKSCIVNDDLEEAIKGMDINVEVNGGMTREECREAALEDLKEQDEWLRRIIEERITVRELERKLKLEN